MAPLTPLNPTNTGLEQEPNTPPVLCLPEDERTSVLVDAFVDWAKRNPEHHDEYFIFGFFSTVGETFPCE